MQGLLRQDPMHAQSRENLRDLLAGRQANGIIFTTMQKFEESHEALSERRNIIVMADEAHRGQYGLTEKIKMTKNEDLREEIAKRVVWYCPHYPKQLAERYIHWLHRYADFFQRSQYPRSVWRLYRHLRYDAGCRGWCNPPGLLRKPCH